MTHPTVPPRGRLLWALVDLDGCLAEPVWSAANPTSAIGVPILESVEQVRSLHAANVKIVIHTSRPDADYEAIESWLNHYGIPFKDIRAGKALGAMYVDDRAVSSRHPDWLSEYRRLTGS